MSGEEIFLGKGRGAQTLKAFTYFIKQTI